MRWWRSLGRTKNNTPEVGNPGALPGLQALRSSEVYQDLKRTHQELKVRERRADVSWKEWYYMLRVLWATLAIVLLGVTLYFTYWLVDGVGTGRLSFDGSSAFLNIIAA